MIEALKQVAARHTVSDGQGFGLEVFPTGALAWRYRYSHNGKSGRVALGKYPAISIQSAGKRRDP